MTDGRKAAEDREADAAGRITVMLAKKAADDLAAVQRRSGLGKTDIVNRALSAWEFLGRQLDAGAEVLVRYPDGTERIVTFL